jgi:hypothetical protein
MRWQESKEKLLNCSITVYNYNFQIAIIEKLTEQNKIVNREIKLELFVQNMELQGCKGVFFSLD